MKTYEIRCEYDLDRFEIGGPDEAMEQVFKGEGLSAETHSGGTFLATDGPLIRDAEATVTARSDTELAWLLDKVRAETGVQWRLSEEE